MIRLDLDRTEEPGECAEHGPFVAIHYRGRGGVCPACVTAAEAIKRARWADEAAKERTEALLTGAGLRGRFRRATFDTFEAQTPQQRKVLSECRLFVAGLDVARGGGLWLLGRVGTGKSHLAAAMAQAFMTSSQRPALVITARDIVRELRATWQRAAEQTEEQVIDRIAGVSLLLLDEVGVGFGTEGEQVQLFDVLDRRYQLQRPTVLISNLDTTNLRTTLGERLFDRLREGTKTLVLDWPSHRKPAERER